MGKQKYKRLKAIRYRRQMQAYSKFQSDKEGALLRLKRHPDKQISDERLKQVSNDYWQSDFNRWLKEHRKTV